MTDLIFYGTALLVSLWIFRIWVADLRTSRRDLPADQSSTSTRKPVFPGAVPVGAIAVVVAIIGAMVLLTAETAGEHRLGISAQQSSMTVLFALYTLAAAFIEEL